MRKWCYSRRLEEVILNPIGSDTIYSVGRGFYSGQAECEWGAWGIPNVHGYRLRTGSSPPNCTLIDLELAQTLTRVIWTELIDCLRFCGNCDIVVSPGGHLKLFTRIWLASPLGRRVASSWLDSLKQVMCFLFLIGPSQRTKVSRRSGAIKPPWLLEESSSC